MSLIAVWLASVEDKNKTLKKTIEILYYILTALAIFLAIKDMSFLERGSTKVWMFLLCLFFPELFIVLHGISTSSMGVSFFGGSPIEKHSHKWFTPASSRMMPDSSFTADSSDFSPAMPEAGTKGAGMMTGWRGVPSSSSSLF